MLFENDINNDEVEKIFDYIVSGETESAEENNKFLKWFQSHNRSGKVSHIRHELARIKNGQMCDQEKINILKNDLFWAVQDEKPTDKIVEAIAILQECKTNDSSQENKRSSSFTAQFNGVLGAMVMLSVAVTAFSYLSMPLCGLKQSKFCVVSRVIPGYISGIFRESARVLPANIKAD